MILQFTFIIRWELPISFRCEATRPAGTQRLLLDFSGLISVFGVQIHPPVIKESYLRRAPTVCKTKLHEYLKQLNPGSIRVSRTSHRIHDVTPCQHRVLAPKTLRLGPLYIASLGDSITSWTSKLQLTRWYVDPALSPTLHNIHKRGLNQFV